MIKDHQGDVCVGFEEQSGVAVVRKENSYYPFGLQFPGTVIPSGANRNLYNGGSEWENAFSNLPDLYRTDHRMYDPALGRFLSPDPLTLSSAGYGTYHYAYNNPLLFNNPLGLKAAPGSGGGITGPYGEFWNYVMSFTAGNGAYITPAKNGWDVAEFSSSEAAFYFASSMMTKNNSWGSYSGWAGSYETAAARYNSSNVGQVAEKFYRLNEVAVNRQGFNSGAWVSQAQAQVANYWNNAREQDIFSEKDIATWGRKASGYLLSASLPFKNAFKRGSLYFKPNAGSRALIIFEKKILGKTIVHQPLFEMSTVKAGKIAAGLKTAGNVIGAAGIAFAVGDIYMNGFTTSNSLDLAMSGLALTGVGSSVAAGYFILNTISVATTDRDIGQHIDSLFE
ncbi:hypothetical protein AAW12_11105 [Sphingobacterium sp. Ag1]|uniref:RHS repeat protein n=1 Tax=Sphingobacterium sp. Ag1 TaxID=1643451 RepID=UPI00062758EB|nr:RHS repeat-associated core domain-containing protein [Sphingobacterium sp. Ag1]KKO91327.1 hypothetical protein AAW12_11105 [Sphingobacterium sp. Ag1]